MLLWFLNNRNKLFKVLFFLSIVVVLVITQMPNITIEQKIENQDKIHHCITFFVLFIQGYLAYKKPFNTAVFLFLYGIAIESLQEFLPFNRTGDLKDLMANGLGILFGYLFIRFINHYLLVLQIKNRFFFDKQNIFHPKGKSDNKVNGESKPQSGKRQIDKQHTEFKNPQTQFVGNARNDLKSIGFKQ